MVSEIKMESKGKRKASLLSFITAPPKIAIAHCGAKPNGRSGHTRYKEAAKINNPKATNTDLFCFIGCNLVGTKIKEEKQTPPVFIH
jgi:hypothetical protein